MLFLLDENIPGHTEDFLIAAGHEVTHAPFRAKDREIAALAEARKAIILTRDRDFLNFLPSALSGIIYTPIHPSIAEHITDAVRQLLNKTDESSLRGNVTILYRNGFEIFH